MEDNVFVSVAKITQDGSKIYATDLYCNNIYRIDLKLNLVEIIGEFSEEEEQIDTIFDIHICDEKLIMMPRTKIGNYIHIFDLITKTDSVLDLKKDILSVNEVYNCFSWHCNEKIYMLNRGNGSIIEYDYLNNKIQKIQKNEMYENIQLAHKFIVEDSIYACCCVLNKIIIYSAISDRMIDITLPKELQGVVSVYKIEKYIIAYHVDSKTLCFFDDKGKLLKTFKLPFNEEHVYPFLHKSEEYIYVYGNRNGEMCKIDIDNDIIITERISELSNKDILYIGECDKYIYFFQTKKLYRIVLNKIIKIDKKTMEIKISDITFDKMTLLEESDYKYAENITKHLLKHMSYENDLIDLQSLIKYSNSGDNIEKSNCLPYGYEIINRTLS